MIKQYYGACLFDDSKIPGHGWSCRPDGDPERISGIHDLGNDINWVTNLEYKAFISNNLGHIKHICQNQFFRESIDALILDYGFGSNRNMEASQFLANHFNNTAIFGNTLTGIDPVKNRLNYRYSQHISNQLNIPILRQGARGITQELADFICESSTQANQAMVGGINGSISLHCYYPRLLYFRWLLSQPVPISTDWNKTALKQERDVGFKNGRIVNEELIKKMAATSASKMQAMFLRISVNSQQKDYATFGTFGRGKKEPREWVTLPELLNICRYSLVTIKEVYTLPMGYLKDHVDFLSDIYAAPDVSISMGLFMQNVAAAIMAPVNKKETPLGAYLRAYDRVGCFHAAEKLYSLGVLPASFSMGRIVTRVTEDQVENTKACMASIGLVPFLGDVS